MYDKNYYLFGRRDEARGANAVDKVSLNPVLTTGPRVIVYERTAAVGSQSEDGP